MARRSISEVTNESKNYRLIRKRNFEPVSICVTKMLTDTVLTPASYNIHPTENEIETIFANGALPRKKVHKHKPSSFLTIFGGLS